MIYEFEGFVPVVHESAFVHPQAAVTGNVVIGRDVYVGPGAAIRGDWGGIVIEDGCNVQESCTVHMFPGVTVVLEEGAHIGHGAIIHGARVGRNTLVGMNAVVMDNAAIGAGCVVGALCFVPTGMVIPDRKVVVGNPAKVVKDVSDEMLAWKTEGTRLYQALPSQLHRSLRAVEPLREVPADRPEQVAAYRTWKATKEGSRAGE
jgi:phenylacetic acid degradation protein